MTRSKLIAVILVALGTIAVAAMSFEAGRRMANARSDEGEVYYTQAMLAFGHYVSYEWINDLLERKCYEAALMVTKDMQNSQVVLLADNLKKTRNDPELLEYVQLRNPELLKSILAGHIPELRTYTTSCPE